MCGVDSKYSRIASCLVFRSSARQQPFADWWVQDPAQLSGPMLSHGALLPQEFGCEIHTPLMLLYDHFGKHSDLVVQHERHAVALMQPQGQKMWRFARNPVKRRGGHSRAAADAEHVPRQLLHQPNHILHLLPNYCDFPYSAGRPMAA